MRELREVGLVDGELPRVYGGSSRGVCSQSFTRSTPASTIRSRTPGHNREIRSLSATPRTATRYPDRAHHGRRRFSCVGPADHRAIQLLAQTEGIFTEPAGGTTLAAAIDLIKRGVIPRDESIVVCVTGNGYKTAEVVAGKVVEPVRLTRAFKEFEAWHESRQALA
jgi:threonine synthase